MAAPRKDLYEVLGVARDADADAIRKAYRRLARKFHPDVNPGDKPAEERFKEISGAYSVLSDADKRRNYDEFGDVALESGFDPEAARRMREAFGTRFRGAPGAGHGPGGFDFGAAGGEEFQFGDLDDLLGRVFSQRGGAGGGGRRRRPAGFRGPDVEATLELDFLEAAHGGERRLSIGRPQSDGSVRSETVTVRIPAGVADGGRIRIPGKGGEGGGAGPPGDLWATIRVRAHAVFRREGRDVHLDVPVRVSEAVRGAKLEIPTLSGRASVTLPPGTDGGQVLRLAGKGIPDPGGGPPGDLFAHVVIRVPRGLDDERVRQLEELLRDESDDPRAELFR